MTLQGPECLQSLAGIISPTFLPTELFPITEIWEFCPHTGQGHTSISCSPKRPRIPNPSFQSSPSEQQCGVKPCRAPAQADGQCCSHSSPHGASPDLWNLPSHTQAPFPAETGREQDLESLNL